MSGRVAAEPAYLAREFASGEAASEIQLDSSPILPRRRHSRSRLRYQNKSTRARNPVSYARYEIYFLCSRGKLFFGVTLGNYLCILLKENVKMIVNT